MNLPSETQSIQDFSNDLPENKAADVVTETTANFPSNVNLKDKYPPDILRDTMSIPIPDMPNFSGQTFAEMQKRFQMSTERMNQTLN